MLLDIIFFAITFAVIVGTVAGLVGLFALDRNLRGK